MSSINEKRTAAASYLLTFYTEIVNLTHNSGIYSNLILKLKEKCGNEDLGGLDEVDQRDLAIMVDEIRLGCYKAFVMYQSVLPTLKTPKPIKDVDKLHKKIAETFIMDVAAVTEYVLEFNKFLANNVIQTLLESNQDILNNVFSNDTKGKPE